jgi:hypothetical protein
MGTWSITPSSSIASIDNNGRATFGNHDSTVTYIIKYQGDDCGTLTTSFTVYKCETPSTCTCGDLTVGGKTVSAEGGSNKVVAKYTAGCVTNIGASSDKDWVTITSTSGGEIKATVGAYTDTTQDRTATITITGTSDNGNCSKQATLTQSKQGGATCDCNTANITNAAGATLESRAYTNPTSVATFNAASCVSEMTVKSVSGGDFLSDFDIESSSSNYSIVAKASENTSTTQERSEIIGIYIDDTKCKEITVKQAEKKETDTISFRGHNCTSEYGTIEVVSITLSDGSTVSCGVAEAVNAGGEEHLGTVDVTGKTGKSITSANVTFNGTSIGSAGISGTITDGAEFTATAGDCGEPGPTCDCSGVEMTASITATSEEGSEGAEGNYPKDCTSRMSYTAPDWVTIRFENGGIMVDHAKNTTTSQRSGTIIIKMDGTTCKTATITQQAGSGSLIHYTANVNCSSSVDASKVCVKFANEAEECGGDSYSYSTTAKSCSVSISSSDSSIYTVSPSTVTLTESSPSYDFEVRNKVVLSAVNASRDSSDLRVKLSAQGEPNCSGQIDLGIKFAYKPPTSDEAVWDETSINVTIDDFNGQEMDITDEIHRDLPAGSYVWPSDVTIISHTFSDTGGDTYDCSDGCTYFTF